MTLLLYTHQPPLPKARFEALLAALPPALRERILRVRNPQAARQSLLGKHLLMEGLSRFGLNGAALLHELAYEASGRPYLPGNIDFNIAHSEEMVICALSEGRRLGVDVEKIRPIDLSAFQAFLTKAEWQEVLASSNPELSFLYFWTKKEAAIKAHGLGLGLPLSEIQVGERAIAMQGKEWPFYEIALGEEYVCHLVVDTELEGSGLTVEPWSFR